MTAHENQSDILGYYTLSTLSIECSKLPASQSRKLPKHPIPTALIGRLAVHKKAQRQGIGEILVVDAIKRTLAVSHDIAVYAIVVDALNEHAERFYSRFGFTPLSPEDPRLFLSIRSSINDDELTLTEHKHSTIARNALD